MSNDYLATSRQLAFERSKAANGYTRTRIQTLGGERIIGEAPLEAQPLATFIHFSDLHICDAKSPARVEFLDRYADPDYETRAVIDYVGTYRPQEFLTLQVLEAMVQSANSIKAGPLLGGVIDGVLVTGDVIDNGQANELDWYKNLMDGGRVSSGSGDDELVEAAHGNHPNFTDDHYYKPDLAEGHRAGDLFGMVNVPGLAQAAQDAFEATGLMHNWYTIHGNHDAMLQGTVTPNAELQAFVTGNRKLNGLVDPSNIEEAFAFFGEIGPAGYPDQKIMTTTEVTADPNRRFIGMADWLDVHRNCGHDHGIDEASAGAYWSRDFGQVRVIALDTVNEHGGWQGCIDAAQFEWLRKLLDDSGEMYVVLTSHHPLQDLFNGYAPDGTAAPVLKDELQQLLEKYPNVIAWVAGHVHDHNISFAKSTLGDFGYWQIRTSSHMDWPQQARIIEIARTTDGRVAIGTQVFNHAGSNITELGALAATTHDDLENPLYLAGVSRILAANDWQRFEGSNSLEVLEGKPEDRNAWLWLIDPML